MSFLRASVFAAVLVVVSVQTTDALRCLQTQGTGSQASPMDCPSLPGMEMDRCMTGTSNGQTVYSCANQQLCSIPVPAGGGTLTCCSTDLCNSPSEPPAPAPTTAAPAPAVGSGNNGAASLAAQSVLVVSVVALAFKHFM